VWHRGRPHRAGGELVRRITLSALSVVLLSGSLACIDFTRGVQPQSIDRIGTGGGGGNSSLGTAVVGQWSATTVSVTPAGEQVSEQTIWDFRPDGTATRTVITTNLSQNTSFVTAESGQWQITGSALVVTLVLPSGGTESFAFQLTGSTLSLDGTTFVRIG
jgi:Lipocalin-like domain